MKHLTISAILFSTSLFYLQAKETPVQPWSGFKVHDENRPHPEKVESKGAVCTAPPENATIIFDGKNSDAFNNPWPIKDGSLIASKIGNTKTKQKFGDCHLHIEWRIPKDRQVKGQKGGNSGVFLMDRYEVQIQESHTNITYADGQAGAIYGQFPPLKNASTPQGEWQSYDIYFKAPRYNEEGMETPAVITVIHNGITVQDKRELHGPTVFRKIASYPKNHPKKAPLQLQWHKDPVEFRNIWIVEDQANKRKDTIKINSDLKNTPHLPQKKNKE